MKFPIIYMQAKGGKVKQWEIWATKFPGYASVTTRYGFIDGEKQENERRITTGKNVGRANETTPFEQACLEAESKWKKKVDKGYVEDMSGESDVRLPMLAQKFTKVKHHIQYPALCQRKLNGVRCFAKKVSDTEMDYTSRKGKSFNGTLEHLTPHFLPIMNVGQIIDGEIYVHGWTFQQIIRAVKKLRPASTELQFHAYDVAEKNVTNYNRLKLLHNYANVFVITVETVIVHSEDEVYALHDKYVKEGYEGVMIRNSAGMYVFNHRSLDLQKYKEFIDEEFEITFVKDGEGLEEGCAIFEVENADKNRFWVRPRGSRKLRQKWYDDQSQIIGKELTVRYQELSEDGIPIFPVGICIRDYE